jgi:uncharacterized protein
MQVLDGPRPDGYPCWLDYAAPDVAAAAAFYADVLGWDYDVSGPEYGHYHVALVGGRAAAGLGQPSNDDTPPVWTVYLATRDVSAFARRAEALGATVLAPPLEVPGQGHLTVLRDPTGAVFAAWQPLGHDGFGVEGTHGAVAWCEVRTPDAVAAERFYTELLEVDSRPQPGVGPEPYLTLGRDDERVAGILQMDAAWEGVPPHWAAYFRVDDVVAAVDAVRAGGGSVDREPFDSTYGRLAAVRDPNGAPFWLLQAPSR